MGGLVHCRWFDYFFLYIFFKVQELISKYEKAEAEAEAAKKEKEKEKEKAQKSWSDMKQYCVQYICMLSF